MVAKCSTLFFPVQRKGCFQGPILYLPLPTGHRSELHYNPLHLGPNGDLYPVIFNHHREKVFIPGFRHNFPGLGGVREMVFLRFYPGLTSLIRTKLSEPGKVVRVNSVGWFWACEFGGNLGGFLFFMGPVQAWEFR